MERYHIFTANGSFKTSSTRLFCLTVKESNDVTFHLKLHFSTHLSIRLIFIKLGFQSLISLRELLHHLLEGFPTFMQRDLVLPQFLKGAQ